MPEFRDISSYINCIKITIENDILLKETKFETIISDFSYLVPSTGFYSLYLLKNNDDNIIPIYIFKGAASFNEYGYITCYSKNINIYNADTNYKIEFDLKSLFEINDIIFLSNSNQILHSIIDQNSKPINYSVVYNKKNIKYNYNPQDYD